MIEAEYIEDLDEIGKTLLIPLWVRYMDYISDDSLLGDEYSYNCVNELGYDFQDFESLPSYIKRITILGIAIRSKILDDLLWDYINNEGIKIIVNMGCGLDARCSRFSAGGLLWINIDVGSTIELRDNILYKDKNHYSISSSIYDKLWVKELKRIQSEYGIKNDEIIFLSEGTLMYFDRVDNMELLNLIKTNFYGSNYIFEILGSWANNHSHPFIKKLGLRIRYKWGESSAKFLDDFSDNWVLRSMFDYRTKEWGLLGILTNLFPFLKRRISSFIVSGRFK